MANLASPLGLNGPMRWVGIWIAIGVAVGVLATRVYPIAYLPPIFEIAMGCIFVGNFWSPERRWVGALCVAYYASTFYGWTIPAQPFAPERWHPIALQASLLISACVALVFVVQLALKADRRPLVWLLIVYILGVAVSYLSSSAGGPSPMINWLIAHGLTADQAHQVTIIIRKTIHFTHYGVLGTAGTLAALAIKHTRQRSAAVGLGIVFATACFDELRQASQPGRTGSAYDVMLDMAGAIVFVLVVLWINRRKRAPAPVV